MNAPARPANDRPRIDVAVVMERRKAPSRWEDWRFRVADVVPHEDAFGAEPRVLRDDGATLVTLHPGFRLELYRDQAEGYFLNLSTAAPCWFVVWRIDDEDAARAWPETVSLSYEEAGRWLDAQERVDTVPLAPPVASWLSAYVDENYRPEPKKRRRPQSFVSPGERR